MQVQSLDLKPLIIMDERERGEIRKSFDIFPCIVDIQTIPVGDYIISPQTAIERKRGDDLVASITDGRLFSQLQNLCQYYSQPVLILENPSRMFDRNGVFDASIYGALVYIAYKLHLTILPTRDRLHTAAVIYRLAEIAQKEAKFEYKPLEIEHAPVSREAQLYFLEGLMQISESRAVQLLEAFESIAGVINAYMNTELVYTKAGKFKGIQGPLAEIKGFGPKIVALNKKILETSFCDASSITLNREEGAAFSTNNTNSEKL
jgi:DNA excision repair protein ERCC-4